MAADEKLINAVRGLVQVVKEMAAERPLSDEAMAALQRAEQEAMSAQSKSDEEAFGP